jgi:2-dehydro-3-deoxygluconokinase
MKIKICAIGECMMELTNAKMELYSQSIAGDTLNFASYLDKKIFDTSYFTAVGTSDVSKRVIIFLQKQKIKTNLVSRISSHEIGLYLIENSKVGEKIFYYWRDNSAAKFFFNNQNIKQCQNQLKKFQYVYFSGITLSLFDNNNFYKFLSLIEFLKKKQIKIIFDFNIRIKRWSKKKLFSYFSKILPFVDILFASGEDLNFLKGNASLKTFKNLIQKYNIEHGIYRNNARLNYSFYKDKRYFIKNKIKNKVVDTSGAGDGYNAAYISKFIKFNDPQMALHAASEIGAKIIMKKGAIVNVK